MLRFSYPPNVLSNFPLPLTAAMVLLEVDIATVRGILDRYANKNPAIYATTAQHAFSLLNTISKEDKILITTDDQKLAAAHNRNDRLKRQVATLKAKVK